MVTLLFLQQELETFVSEKFSYFKSFSSVDQLLTLNAEQAFHRMPPAAHEKLKRSVMQLFDVTEGAGSILSIDPDSKGHQVPLCSL